MDNALNVVIGCIGHAVPSLHQALIQFAAAVHMVIFLTDCIMTMNLIFQPKCLQDPGVLAGMIVSNCFDT